MHVNVHIFNKRYSQSLAAAFTVKILSLSNSSVLIQQLLTPVPHLLLLLLHVVPQDRQVGQLLNLLHLLGSSLGSDSLLDWFILKISDIHHWFSVNLVNILWLNINMEHLHILAVEHVVHGVVMIKTILHHGDGLDLGDVTISSDVKTLLLMEAGSSLDDSELASPHSTRPGHHVAEVVKLKHHDDEDNDDDDEDNDDENENDNGENYDPGTMLKINAFHCMQHAALYCSLQCS